MYILIFGEGIRQCPRSVKCLGKNSLSTKVFPDPSSLLVFFIRCNFVYDLPVICLCRENPPRETILIKPRPSYGLALPNSLPYPPPFAPSYLQPPPGELNCGINLAIQCQHPLHLLHLIVVYVLIEKSTIGHPLLQLIT